MQSLWPALCLIIRVVYPRRAKVVVAVANSAQVTQDRKKLE